jgi:hypothetical protein
MRMISTYLENAIRFERLAAQESDPALKTEFGKQAISYRKLAAERARKLVHSKGTSSERILFSGKIVPNAERPDPLTATPLGGLWGAGGGRAGHAG